MGYKVIFGAKADRDLLEIVRFIAQENPAAAEQTGLAIVDATLKLDELPYRCPVVAGRRDFRRLVVAPHYAVCYRVNEDLRTVEIATIWDGRRKPADLRLG
jgi:plasmid stabilization system protein ParE